MKKFYYGFALLILFSLNGFSQLAVPFAWINGDTIPGLYSVYGIKGIPNALNKPGGRSGASSWKDPSGNFWLFGGSGYGRTAQGYLNDLWRYDTQTGHWTWISGDDFPNQYGVYSQGLKNKPGARENAVTWTDKSGNLWLFGGKGKASVNSGLLNSGELNDLWRYDRTNDVWACMSGDSMAGRGGIYKNDGIFPDTLLKPGSRQYSTTWTDILGNLWLFGGIGYGSDRFGHIRDQWGQDHHLNHGWLNDLWKFNPGTRLWTWVRGNDSSSFYITKDIAGYYGRKGVPDPGNVPAMTAHAYSWTDDAGNLWLFGGERYKTTSHQNAVWKFSPTTTIKGVTGIWTWMHGDSLPHSPAVYGTKGKGASANTPAGRAYGYSWKDNSGNFWLFGGYPFLNDLWQYKPSVNLWTWVGGDSITNGYAHGVYGIKGIFDIANLPGRRYGGVSWTDSAGSLWLLGGYGYGAWNSGPGPLNDLWKISAPSPLITDFSPVSGPVGTTVTLNGEYFNPIPANNIVFFGEVRATVTGGSTTRLTVTAPAGSIYKPITVLDKQTGLTGYSSEAFITTFLNPFGNGIPTNFYKPKIDFPVGTFPRSIAIGDLDGDGKPDLVTANEQPGNISVLRNTSNSGTVPSPSFAPKVDFSATNPHFVAIGDLDGDGRPDIVVANQSSNTISVFRNTSVSGNLTASWFAPKVDFSTGIEPSCISIGDIDVDGKPDLVIANSKSNYLSVLRNTSLPGNPNRISFAARLDIDLGSTPYAVAIDDVDGDLRPDLIVALGNANTISILRNISTFGRITTASFASKVDFSTGITPFSVAIGDMDGDGMPPLYSFGGARRDIVVANASSSNISVLRNTSTVGGISTTSFAPKVDFSVGISSPSIAIGDLDGDGKRDIAVTILFNSTVSVLRNTSVKGSINASSFAPNISFNTGASPCSVTIGDIDGDGIPELLTANLHSHTVSVLKMRSSNAKLSNLVLSQGNLIPVFSQETTSYQANVANSVTFITIKPTVIDINATITVNGNIVVSGTASPDIPLNVGGNTITTLVTAENGVTTKTYTVTVTRAASTNANLSNLTISRGTLIPAFVQVIKNYHVSVANDVTSIWVTPTVADTTATIEVNDIAVLTGRPSDAITLKVGDNRIKIKVTAQDGKTTKTYIVNVERAKSSDADLALLSTSEGTLTPAFHPGIIKYNVLVANNKSMLTVTPTAAHIEANIKVDGRNVRSGQPSRPILLPLGEYTINVKVTAEDNITYKTYSITVTRAAGQSANTTGISPNAEQSTNKKVIGGEDHSELYAEVNLRIFPNPVQDGIALVSYRLADAGNVILSVIDFNGRILQKNQLGLLNPGVHTYTLGKLSKLPKGDYIVVLEQRNRMIARKQFIIGR